MGKIGAAKGSEAVWPAMKIRKEDASALAEYAAHLKNLSDADRYSRFGYAARPEQVDRLILNMLYQQHQHHLFVARRSGIAVGFVHLAQIEDGSWELAVSVESESQGRGVADSLMSHALSWAKVQAVDRVFMHCISENARVQHLARKHGLRTVERSAGEITAALVLPPATFFDYAAEFARTQQRMVEMFYH
jgi:GNAT superfamily N-acetyltransferase